jgi:MATE family multidrug resistance protein
MTAGASRSPFALLGADSRFRWSGLGFVGAGMSLSVSRCCQPIAYYLYMFVYKKAHLPTWPGWTLGFLRLSRVRAFMAQAVPLIGTQIVQSLIFQATTLLVAQLGTLAVAASSAVGAATQVFTAGLAAAFIAVAAVRIGYHLGRNDVRAAQGSVTLVVAVSLLSSSLSIAICTPLSRQVASLVTDDPTTLPVAASLVGAALVGAGSAQLVGIGTSGVFGGQGRTLVSTILSFGFELPMTLAGVAIPVYLMKVGGGEGLLIVYWAWVVVNVIEVVVVGSIISCSNWRKYAEEAVRRQESNNTARADAAGVPSVDAADEDGAEGPGNPPEAGPGETRAGPPAAGLAGGVRRL